MKKGLSQKLAFDQTRDTPRGVSLVFVYGDEKGIFNHIFFLGFTINYCYTSDRIPCKILCEGDLMDYKKSRDAVWQILIKNKISSLPISVEKICKSEHVRLFTYREGTKIIEQLSLESHTKGNDAFSFSQIIFYDDQTSLARQRFSIAHELGHIILHQPTYPTVLNREISPNDDPMEAEANVFASQLLAPMCVIHFLNVNTPQEIAELCQISRTAAEIRYQRLCLIRERDRKMVNTNGYGCFLLSPLERKVYTNFKRYILKNKR